MTENCGLSAYWEKPRKPSILKFLVILTYRAHKEVGLPVIRTHRPRVESLRINVEKNEEIDNAQVPQVTQKARLRMFGATLETKHLQISRFCLIL